MKWFWRASAVLVLTGFALAQDGSATADRSSLAFRSQQELNNNNFAGALAMLQKLEVLSKDQPDQLGPIQEKIRVCQKNLAAATQPSGPATLPGGRVPHPAPVAGQVLQMDIKELGNFDYDADRGGNIPDDVKGLSGQEIKLHGFMIPMDQAANITQFALVPSLFACCFGQPPQIQHTIVVNCPKGKTVGYYPDEISVQGTLKVDEKRDEGFIVSIFEISAESVKPLAK